MMLAALTALQLLGAAAFAADLTLTTDDGVRVHAVHQSAKGTRGVVLVHMVGRSSEDWSYLAGKLNQRGLQTVAVDLRGHGLSAVEGGLTDADWPAMVNEVRAAVAWLRAHGSTEVVLVGASVGANLVLQAAARDPGVLGVALLSPGIDYKGVTTLDALALYGDRPALVLATAGDRYAAKSAEALAARAPGAGLEVQVLEGTAHGTAMLGQVPAVEPAVVNWVAAVGGPGAGTVRREVTVPGDTTRVEADGKAIGEK